MAHPISGSFDRSNGHPSNKPNGRIRNYSNSIFFKYFQVPPVGPVSYWPRYTDFSNFLTLNHFACKFLIVLKLIFNEICKNFNEQTWNICSKTLKRRSEHKIRLLDWNNSILEWKRVFKHFLFWVFFQWRLGIFGAVFIQIFWKKIFYGGESCPSSCLTSI